MNTGSESVTVVGAGYVGIVTAVGLAEAGHRVRLIETADDRLAALEAGEVPFFEAGLQEGFARAVAAGRLAIERSIEPHAPVVMICVGTPIGDDGRSDLSQLRSALEALEPLVGPETIVVLRSTLPVGATRKAAGWTSVPTSRLFTNPEFLRQGTALADFRHPSRLIIGCFEDADEAALSRVRSLVGVDGVDTLVVDVTASELIKNGANAFLALKLSFANELAGLSEEMGTDIGDVLTGISADPRIGSSYLKPSFGFGGSCLPKELSTLAVAGRSVGLPMHVTAAASQANAAQQMRFADRLAVLVGGLQSRTIGMLGLAFKAGTDDVRGSPAIRLAESLIASGAVVRAFDPAAMANAKRALPELHTVPRAPDVFDGAHALVIATDWPEFATLPFDELGARMAERLIVDGRRLLNAPTLRGLGFRVSTVGTGSST